MVDQPRWGLDSERIATRASRGTVGAMRVRDNPSVLARVLFGGLLLFSALLQATFIPALGVFSVYPDFALVLLLIWSSVRGAAEGMVWAVGLGLWLDLLTLDPLGTHAIALLAVAAMGGAVRGRLFRSGAILPVLAVIVATLAYDLALVVIHILQGGQVDVAGAMRLALLNALLNALLVPVLYGLLALIERWMPRRVP